MGLLPKRYARAIVALTKGPEEMKTIQDELLQFRDLLKREQNLKKILHHPVLTFQEKRGVLEAILAKGKSSTLLRNSLVYILKMNRFTLLSEIIDALSGEVDLVLNQVDVVIETAVKHSEQELKGIKDTLKDVLNGQTPIYRLEVNSELIGGVRVQIGHTIYDRSVKRQLEKLRDQIQRNR